MNVATMEPELFAQHATIALELRSVVFDTAVYPFTKVHSFGTFVGLKVQDLGSHYSITVKP
jgi:hypothetical protein